MKLLCLSGKFKPVIKKAMVELEGNNLEANHLHWSSALVVMSISVCISSGV